MVLPLALTLMTAACDGGGAFKNYSNYDLKEANNECKKSSQTPGSAQRCNNVAKECERRKVESGFRC